MMVTEWPTCHGDPGTSEGGELLGTTGGTGRVAEAGECGRELGLIEHFGRET